MPLKKIHLCSGICLLYTAALIAQAPPKNKSLTNVVGYQLYQQKQWNEKQLPKNSILYKSNIKNISPGDYKISPPNLQLPQVPQPTAKKSFFTIPSSTLLPGLNSYTNVNGLSYYKWQKHSWWKYLPD